MCCIIAFLLLDRNTTLLQSKGREAYFDSQDQFTVSILQDRSFWVKKQGGKKKLTAWRPGRRETKRGTLLCHSPPALGTASNS